MGKAKISKLCLHPSPLESSQVYPTKIAGCSGHLSVLLSSSGVQLMIKFLLKPNVLSPHLLYSKKEPYTAGSKYAPFLENKQLC